MAAACPRWYNAALTHTKWMGNPSSPTLSSNCENRRACFCQPAQGWMCEVYYHPLELFLIAQIDQGDRTGISLSAVRPRVTWALFLRHANHSLLTRDLSAWDSMTTVYAIGSFGRKCQMKKIYHGVPSSPSSKRIRSRKGSSFPRKSV